MKKILFTALLLSPFIFFSCNSGGSGDPKAVLAKFFEALSKKDIEAARKLSTESSKSMIDMMDAGMKMDKGSKESDKFDPKSMEYGEVKIEGDKATIPVKEIKSGETLNYILKKEKGEWKVAFDKESMMNMGMEKMNEKGINAPDSLNKAMEELKNMNMDSLKEGMQMLDSVNKEYQKMKDK